nr:MAG TPA: hypothetical protein [Caudoviricetes sp.]
MLTFGAPGYIINIVIWQEQRRKRNNEPEYKI